MRSIVFAILVLLAAVFVTTEASLHPQYARRAAVTAHGGDESSEQHHQVPRHPKRKGGLKSHGGYAFGSKAFVSHGIATKKHHGKGSQRKATRQNFFKNLGNRLRSGWQRVKHVGQRVGHHVQKGLNVAQRVVGMGQEAAGVIQQGRGIVSQARGIFGRGLRNHDDDEE
ncbi:hypothetical protein LEN26_001746 [Aphanomyces euteiches]|nr:hypothetical protein AeMF1_012697 [Aphanomyces euteiches]KAH9160679.1 hypothetical protein LEN26_001746 [Aphanomyces euteiches]KAH9181247.1 hypothetical protein AeNC1_016776 [Aphanomyces euteiches]